MSSKAYVIARYEGKGRKFEILVKPDLALKLREGKKVNIDEVLVGDFVYKDVRRGLKASPEDLKYVFGTDDIRKVAEVIIKKGELQLTTEQRRALLEAKRKQIITYIARSAIDPRTKTPIPPSRIEAAMQEVRVAVDLYKPIEEQAVTIVKAISRIIPIKLAKALLRIKVPPQYSGKFYGIFMRLGEVKRSQWLSDGSLLVEVEIPAGMQSEVIDKVNKLTKGSAEIKVLAVV